MTASVRRAVRLEHRLTQPTATLADLDAAVALAAEHEIAALTVNPWLVKAAKRRLGRSRVTLGTVIGFPHGSQVLSVKAFEASKALEQGATQIDFVLNGGALASGDEETVFNDMLAVVDMAHSALAASGVIMEPDDGAQRRSHPQGVPARRARRRRLRRHRHGAVVGERDGRPNAHPAGQRRAPHRRQGGRPVPHRRPGVRGHAGRRDPGVDPADRDAGAARIRRRGAGDGPYRGRTLSEGRDVD